MPKKPRLSTFLLFSAALLIFGGSIVAFFFFFSDGSRNETDYRPKFRESPFELVQGDGFRTAHLYYRIDKNSGEKYDAGQIAANLRFIAVSPEGDPQSGRFRITPLDNIVDEVQSDYVVFTFPEQNFDCFAVYRDQELVAYERKNFGRLPTSSDAWMCKGFDFKNVLKNQ